MEFGFFKLILIILISSFGFVSRSDAIIAINSNLDFFIPKSIAPPTNGFN